MTKLETSLLESIISKIGLTREVIDNTPIDQKIKLVQLAMENNCKLSDILGLRRNIEIKESNEPVVEIDRSIPRNLPHPYATAGAPYGELSPFHARKSVAEAILKAQEILQQSHPSLSLVLFDVGRPFAVQDYMVRLEASRIFTNDKNSPVIYSDISEIPADILEKVYQVWAPPKRDPNCPTPHSTFGTVDVMIQDANGKLLDFGAEFDEPSDRILPNFYKPHIDDQSQIYHANRELLRNVMEQAGFTRLTHEFWDFSMGTQYANLVRSIAFPEEDVTAIYGEVVELLGNALASATFLADPNQPILHTDWQRCLELHRADIGEEVYNVINTQRESFSMQEAPKIADPVIKEIPIIESREPFIDIINKDNPRIKMMPNPASPFESPNYNSGFAVASMVRESVYRNLEKMLEHLDTFATLFGYSPGSIDIKVFEGLRSIDTQEKLFNDKVEEIRSLNPSMSEEAILSEASKWVSPTKNNIPVHSTGGAVDIRLWNNKTGEYVDMGMFGVIWGMNNVAPTFSENLTSEQKNNRLYLLSAAVSAGFINYPYEWWHLSVGDRYASYILQPISSLREARFGSVKEDELAK